MTVHDVARGLPDIPTLRDVCRSMAMLEAVLNPDGERYYSYSRTSPHLAAPGRTRTRSLR
ncbi:hypothetical protein ACFRAO_18040 [Streptomyces sp. NPDC056656]|uniref:hypothetical protein n=1 Tax=Streptomyces sp. NPDC056656 TaxID=3345895 RepID=UPI003695D7FE